MLCKPCSRNSGDCPPTGMKSLCPGTLLQENLDARSRAAGDSLGPNQLVFVKPKQLPGSDRGGEMRHQAGRMVADLVEAATDRSADPNAGLGSGYKGGENRFAARAE